MFWYSFDKTNNLTLFSEKSEHVSIFDPCGTLKVTGGHLENATICGILEKCCLCFVYTLPKFHTFDIILHNNATCLAALLYSSAGRTRRMAFVLFESIFSRNRSFWVTLGDFTIKNAKLGREIWYNLKSLSGNEIWCTADNHSYHESHMRIHESHMRIRIFRFELN